MTPRNFPPADQCTAEDLDAIADLVVSDPSASWALAGSREHIEVLCRRYQELAQELSVAVQERDAARWANETRAKVCETAIAQRDAARGTIAALERDLAQVANRADEDEAADEVAYLKARNTHQDERRAALGDLAFDLLADLDSAGTEIRALQGALDHERNERQAEVLAAEADRERADEAETAAELFETIARTMWTILARRVATDPPSLDEVKRAVDGRLARALQREQRITTRLTEQLERMALLLDQQAETRRLDDQLRSTCRTITGKDLGEVNIQLDEELAAHPDAVCTTCRDTHWMKYGADLRACTHCPLPCDSCRARNSAYCTTTPCACGCHGPDYPRPPGPLHHARDQRDHQEDTTP